MNDRNDVLFVRAQPIWPAGQERVMNTFIGFRTVLDLKTISSTILKLTASTLYRVSVNGQFAGHGPARAAHGYYRVDEWPIEKYLRPGKNVIAIEVAGYNVNSYYLLNQPAFLQAEIIADGQVLAATRTEDSSFTAEDLNYRVRKVQRFSFQRPFIEVYRLNPESQSWRDQPDVAGDTLRCALQPQHHLLARGLNYPTFETRGAMRHVASGTLAPSKVTVKKDRSLTEISPNLLGYPESELELVPTNEFQQFTTHLKPVHHVMDCQTQLGLSPLTTHIVDMGTNLSGFVGMKIQCKTATRLTILWEELLTDGDIPCVRVDCANLIDLHLAPGTYHFESFEPYTMRYLKLIGSKGECSVSDIYIRQYVTPDADRFSFVCGDEELNRITNAAVESFRQNSADLLTDCPSRERAGWLCDSFFSGRSAYVLTGSTVNERKFLEDFLLAPQLPELPQGMIPMCYPADHLNGGFIPQWPMWLVLELEEYLHRSGDAALIEAYQKKIESFIGYFDAFVNSDGLLEDLKGWRFVEWSKANEFVDGVNYPTNMLFAQTLEVAGRLYHHSDYARRAARMRDAISRQSFDGQWFRDNALRRNGKLTPTENRTEVCQYFAFFFGLATSKTHQPLWHTLCTEFGPQRKSTHAHPDIHFANAFIGNYLRLELLTNHGLYPQVIKEVRGYFLNMADTTGTLWENDGAYASCNHCFTSYVTHWLLTIAAGLRKLDLRNKTVIMAPTADLVPWAIAQIPIPGGMLTIRRRYDGNGRRPEVTVPAEYRVIWEEK